VTSSPRATDPPDSRESIGDSLRRSAGTTPGRLSLTMVGLVVLSLLTGVIGLLSIQGKASTLSDLTANREPFAAAAQQMYRSLSDADATVAGAFLSSAVQPPALRERYQTDIDQAGAALAVAATDISGVAEAAKPLQQLSTGIPSYTGLVERASTNNAQGYPVGSAYLREADNLMQATLLPAAQALYAVDTTRLVQSQDSATSFPWAVAVLVVMLFVALIVTQRWLRRRTHRVINVGLLVATIAVVVAVLWSATGLVFETIHVASARSAGSDPADVLAQARTKALQARTDEMLTLVARGGQDYGQPFKHLTAQIGGTNGAGGLLGQVRSSTSDSALTGDINKAITAAASWFDLHAKATGANQNGDYATATAITLGTSTGQNEAAAFDKVDTALSDATLRARTIFTEQTNAAGGWLTALPVGVLVLFLVAAVGTTAGLWQRLREYR
jgi:hypothetical protein